MLITQRQLALAHWLSNSSSTRSETFTIEEIIENGVTGIALKNLSQIKSKTLKTTLIKVDQQLHIIHNLQLQSFIAVFKAFSKANIPFVVLKGWALSYTVYAKPHHRPKTDIDILINEENKDAVKDIFEQHQFKNPRGWEPKGIIDQFTMRKTLVQDVYANVDIHLKISDDKLIQSKLTWAQVYSNKPRINCTLGATVPSTAFLIIHAAVHLLHHYAHGDLIKLIWLFDIYLLIEKAHPNDISTLKNELQRTGLAKPFTRVVNTVLLAFPNSKSQELLKITRSLTSSSEFDYLLQPPSPIKSYIRKLQQSQGLNAKFTVITETLFPPEEEIFRKYGKVSKWSLPYYYLHRITTGIIRRLLK